MCLHACIYICMSGFSHMCTHKNDLHVMLCHKWYLRTLKLPSLIGKDKYMSTDSVSFPQQLQSVMHMLMCPSLKYVCRDIPHLAPANPHAHILNCTMLFIFPDCSPSISYSDQMPSNQLYQSYYSHTDCIANYACDLLTHLSLPSDFSDTLCVR